MTRSKRIGVERALERLARLGFVAGAHQVHARGRRRRGVFAGIERDGLPRQRHRLLEAIVARRQIRGDAVDLAVGRD